MPTNPNSCSYRFPQDSFHLFNDLHLALLYLIFYATCLKLMLDKSPFSLHKIQREKNGEYKIKHPLAKKLLALCSYWEEGSVSFNAVTIGNLTTLYGNNWATQTGLHERKERTPKVGWVWKRRWRGWLGRIGKTGVNMIKIYYIKLSNN